MALTVRTANPPAAHDGMDWMDCTDAPDGPDAIDGANLPGMPLAEAANAQVFARILRFLLGAGDPEAVAHRAVTCLGLLPQVRWAALDGEPANGPAGLSIMLADDGSRLDVQLTTVGDPRAAATVESLMGLAAQVYQRERRIQRLAAEAHTDPLTGLFNRRGFAPFVQQALARTARTGEHTCLLACDLDNFKTVNDTLGHDAGDRALIAVADALRHVIRPSDIAARLGGDEIAILLTSADAAGAMVVADRLRASLAADNPLTDHTLTLSIGIADAAASGSNCTVAALMGMADEALYMAKARGRDRAVAHPGCVPALQLVEDEPTSPIVLAG